MIDWRNDGDNGKHFFASKRVPRNNIWYKHCRWHQRNSGHVKHRIHRIQSQRIPNFLNLFPKKGESKKIFRISPRVSIKISTSIAQTYSVNLTPEFYLLILLTSVEKGCSQAYILITLIPDITSFMSFILLSRNVAVFALQKHRGDYTLNFFNKLIGRYRTVLSYAMLASAFFDYRWEQNQ